MAANARELTLQVVDASSDDTRLGRGIGAVLDGSDAWWNSRSPSDNEWLLFDAGEPVEVVRVDFQHTSLGATERQAKDCELQVGQSEHGPFQVAHTFSTRASAKGDAAWQRFEGLRGRGRFWKLCLRTKHGDPENRKWVAVQGVKMFGMTAAPIPDVKAEPTAEKPKAATPQPASAPPSQEVAAAPAKLQIEEPSPVGCEAEQDAASTLAQSNFKPTYNSATAPRFQHMVFDVLFKFILAIATLKGIAEAQAETFFQSLQAQVMEKSEIDDWLTDVPRLAMKLWTSNITMAFGREFCSLLNEVIRSDQLGEAFTHAMTLTRLMNTLIVTDRSVRKDARIPSPKNNETFRGSGIPWIEVQKFIVGLSYRVSMFVATAFVKKTAYNFLKKVASPLVPVLFIFQLDEDLGVDHAMYLEGLTLVEGEWEFLYSPYSAFTVVKVELPPGDAASIRWSNPVIITLAVAPDNLAEPEDLPTISWH